MTGKTRVAKGRERLSSEVEVRVGRRSSREARMILGHGVIRGLEGAVPAISARSSETRRTHYCVRVCRGDSKPLRTGDKV